MKNNDRSIQHSGDNTDEYFQLKKTAKTLRADLKQLKEQHEDYNELQKLTKKVTEIRNKIKEDSKIKELSEKLKSIKERMDLLKEMIRIELLENSQEEVEKDGMVLKLVYVVKEMRSKETAS
ncbi:MAG: hypothetical protein Kow0081_3220 [Candidatus Dojkabacteria bacterium]